MELPCLSLEPPLLLRRPLPPKVLPVLKGKSQLTKDQGVIPLYLQQQFQETSLVHRYDYEKSQFSTNFSEEKRNRDIKNWILDQQPLTPAASRLNSDDYPLNGNNLDIQSRIQGQHEYVISEQTHNGQLMHSGPADFPLKRRHKQRIVNILPSSSERLHYERSPPELTFKDITVRSTHYVEHGSDAFNKHMVSRQHYSKMEDNIARLRQNMQEKVHDVLLSSNKIPEVSKRIPLHQLALEEQQTHLKEAYMKCLNNIGGSSASQFFKSQNMQNPGSLYQDQSKILATHCDLAILECLVHGGTALSLKAYFISVLPDLTLLQDTLFYLNLSFNEFWQFPKEVYQLQHLESLYLRNNPIKEIPDGIQNLQKLRTLILSFCSLTFLPDGLFQISNLQVLDVSYNNITSIPNEIANLRALEFLNVEGNHLPALPCGALKLRLKHLRVGNNQMHPLFWPENTHIQPQRLCDLAAMSFAKNHMIHDLTAIPTEAKNILCRLKTCDCCKGIRSGDGLRFIRPCEKIFGVRKLPFAFHACSPSCYNTFMSQTDSLTQYLYES